MLLKNKVGEYQFCITSYMNYPKNFQKLAKYLEIYYNKQIDMHL